MANEVLGTLAEIVMGQSPPGESCNTHGEGIPLLNGPTEFGSHHPVPVQFTKDPRKFAKPEDILFCVRGSTTGRMNWANRDYAIGRGIAAIRHKKGQALQPFLRALIEYHLPELLVQATGSTFPNVSYSQLAELPCAIPSGSEQKTIAVILGSLDDKIELNCRINETPESIARTIFKSWFVDFDPVRAKAEGRDPGLPKEIADLFPNGFEDSKIGNIPKKWEVNLLSDLIELSYGKGLKEKDRQPGNVAVFGSNGQIGWHNEKFVDGPGIIVGRKGNPGIVTWAPPDFFPIDTTFYVVPKEHCGSLYFLFYALCAQDLPSLAADSAVPGLNRNLAYMNQQVVPPSAILKVFDALVKPLFDRIKANNDESSTLAAIQDALLPKLISGELRVPTAEKLIEHSEIGT